MNFYSDAKQDKFVANLFNFKKNGFFIDIGSCGAIDANNTYALEHLNWTGLCIEIDPRHKSSYDNRKCNFIQTDATKVDYKKLFEDNNVPKSIDYLSLDIDSLSYDVLTILPHSEYRFKTITIEHDSYVLGDTYSTKQRRLLNEHGYLLLCENVFVEQPGFGPNLPFEDWWIDPNCFDNNLINKIKCDNNYPSFIVSKF